MVSRKHHFFCVNDRSFRESIVSLLQRSAIVVCSTMSAAKIMAKEHYLQYRFKRRKGFREDPDAVNQATIIQSVNPTLLVTCGLVPSYISWTNLKDFSDTPSHTPASFLAWCPGLCTLRPVPAALRGVFRHEGAGGSQNGNNKQSRWT